MRQTKPTAISMENTKRNFSLPIRSKVAGASAQSLITPTVDIPSTPELNKILISGQDLGDLAILTPNGISSVIPNTTVLPSPLIPTTVNSNNIINANNANNNQNYGCVHSNINNNLKSSNKSNGQNGDQNQSTRKRFDKSREVDTEKIEKKRERNRLAAKKCRQRKLETIDELRKTVSEWETKYQRLERDMQALIQENTELKRIARRS